MGLLLTRSDVVPYLIDRKLLSKRAVVRGDLAVIDVSRRNRNFKVISQIGPSYLIKQRIGREGNDAIAHETHVYRSLHSLCESSVARRFLVRSYGYDRRAQVLVLEALTGAQSLDEHYRRCGRISLRSAATLGTALGTLHRLAISDVTRRIGDQLPIGQPPWVLSVHRLSLSMLQRFSYANLQVTEIVQRFPGFGELLDELRDGWRSEALIHGDLRWDNCLVSVSPGRQRTTELKIVDWELASVGDRCWDIGVHFGEYLSYWLLSIPVTPDNPPDRYMQHARYPLWKMQPAMRIFWRSYVLRMGMEHVVAEEWLKRSVRYAAVRLLQTAYELTLGAMVLSPGIVCLLQMSLNMLQRPEEAIIHLLGIPLGQAGAV